MSGTLRKRFAGAARDRVDDGTPERVVMAMTGHRTRAMFDRYSIASTTDIEAALLKATLPAGKPGRPRNETR